MTWWKRNQDRRHHVIESSDEVERRVREVTQEIQERSAEVRRSTETLSRAAELLIATNDRTLLAPPKAAGH